MSRQSEVRARAGARKYSCAEAQARRAEEAAEAEGLTLKRSSNQTGFACVYVDPKNKEYQNPKASSTEEKE